MMREKKIINLCIYKLHFLYTYTKVLLYRKLDIVIGTKKQFIWLANFCASFAYTLYMRCGTGYSAARRGWSETMPMAGCCVNKNWTIDARLFHFFLYTNEEFLSYVLYDKMCIHRTERSDVRCALYYH